MPVLYDLFWNAGPPRRQRAAVAQRTRGATVVTPPRFEAIILFPAFFTPGVYFPSDPAAGGCFELLMATPSGVQLRAVDVNHRLKVVRGLGWTRRASPSPLFPTVEHRISVRRVEPDGDGILSTHSQFQGILHSLATRHLRPTFDAYWAVRVHVDALRQARPADEQTGAEVEDPLDTAIARLFRARNGPSFQLPHTFQVDGVTVFPEVQPPDRPVLAHHPVAVYPESRVTFETVGHVTDLHLNMRQDVLAQSNARVIECPDADDVSPPIGRLVNRYSRSTLAILKALPAATDAVVVGGDLVDHIKNATLAPGTDHPANAAAVWERVSMASPAYERHYQAGPDFIAAFSAFRSACQEKQVPMFGVTGNHDAYVEGYGISPRVSNNRQWRKLANEGIAADHNLTLFEAILAFGPTYAEYRGVRGTGGTLWENSSNFDATWLDWYHTVFSPFASFAVRLPRQRLVCLGWGEREHMIGRSAGQGFGHLPRATGAVLQPQEALLRSGFSSDRPTLLASHFTLASFGESIAESPGPGGVLPHGRIGFGSQFGDFDYGTFEERRTEVYIRVGTHRDSMAAVLTGHSHRKALYLLECNSTSHGTASMVGLAGGSIRRDTLPRPLRDQTAIVLSDSGGPLPRSNVSGEFGIWGSDASSGTILGFDRRGRLESVRVLRGRVSAAPKPRAVVSLEYLHYQDDEVWDGAVLEFQAMTRDAVAAGRPPAFWVTLKRRWEQTGIGVSRVAFFGRLTRQSGPSTWIRVDAQSAGESWSDPSRRVRRDGVELPRRFPLWRIPAAEVGSFRNWTSIGSAADRFVALQFDATASEDAGLIGRYDWSSWWTFEVAAERDGGMPTSVERWRVRPVAGGWFGDETSSERPVIDQPDFGFRRRAFPWKYRRAAYQPTRTRR